MDPREQIGNFTDALEAMLDGRQTQIWSAMPGIIQSFNPDEMTCVVQISLLGLQTKADGSQIPIQIPPCVDCPVVFPSGGGFAMTFWPEKDDECLLVLASRCIDAWWQSGGIQRQQVFRMHDLSDGFVIPGPKSLPNALAGIKRHAVQLRSNDGATYLELNSDQECKIVAPGGVTINGVQIDSSANVSAVGTLNAAGEGTFNGHTVGAHTHTQGNDSHGDTEVPTNPPTG